jgi:hypothetical protein
MVKKVYTIKDTNGNYNGSINLSLDETLSNLEWDYFAWKYINRGWTFTEVGKHNALNQVELLRALRDAAGISKELDWEVIEVNENEHPHTYNGQGKNHVYFTMPVVKGTKGKTKQIYKEISAKYKTTRVA